MSGDYCFSCAKFCKKYYQCVTCETALYCSLECKNKDNKNHLTQCFNYQYQKLKSNIGIVPKLDDCKVLKNFSVIKQIDRLGARLFYIFDTIKEIIHKRVEKEFEIEVMKYEIVGINNHKLYFLQTEILHSCISYYILTCNSIQEIIDKTNNISSSSYIKLFIKKFTKYVYTFIQDELKGFCYFVIDEIENKKRVKEPHKIIVNLQTIKHNDQDKKIICVSGDEKNIVFQVMPEYYKILFQSIERRFLQNAK